MKLDANAATAEKGSDADSQSLLLKRLAHNQEIGTTLESFPGVQSNSVLEDDDRVLGGYELSTLVLNLLTTATHISSNLAALVVVDTVNGTEVLAPLHGPYALVRAQMESTSQALWLMAPQSRRTRIRRCVQYWCSEVKLFNSFRNEWSKSFSSSQEGRGYEDLRVIILGAGLSLEGFPDKKLWASVGSGDILKSIEFAHGEASLTWFNTWQLCSGFAHSKQWASRIFNEQHDATEGSDRHSPHGSKTSLPVLASVVNEAGLLLDEACRRYSQLSTTPQAAWPRLNSSVSFAQVHAFLAKRI